MTEQTRIGNRYRLERRVGAGSMGVVWQAVDELLGRQVAMKELLIAPQPTGGAQDDGGAAAEEAQARILREGRLAARLQHPHTIAVFDVVLHDHRPWLVMEYLPSLSLARVLADGGTLPPPQAASVGEQIADGLAAAHAAGIVHRDVKPGNVLITEDGTVKLTDFGVSWAADDVALTRTGLIQGTPAFLAPEVARGKPPTAASDVFALGATLYTAVEGEPPFGLSDNTLAQLHIVAKGKVRPPSQAGQLTAALMTLLRADPGERPTASEARAVLAAIATGASAAAVLDGLSARRDGAGPLNAPRSGSRAGARNGPGGPSGPGGGPGNGAMSPARVPPGTAPLPAPADERLVRDEAAGRHASFPPAGAGRPRRSRMVIFAVVLGLLVLAGAGTLVAMAATAPPPPAAPASAARSAAPATTQQALPTEPVAFVDQYYALLPRNTDAAFALLGPEAQRQYNGLAGYRSFYAQMAEVSVVEGPRAAGDDVVQLTVRFLDKAGGTNDEEHRLLVRPDGTGQLRIVGFSFRRA